MPEEEKLMDWQVKQREYEAKKARAKALKLRLTCTICGEKAKLNCPCGTMYCSEACQRIDWRDRGHRKACKKIRADRAAEAARAEAPPSAPPPTPEVVYGPAPRSRADEVRARIAAEHEAARARREANPERAPTSERFGSRCPICMEEWDVNASNMLRICCCRRVCNSCEERIGYDSCPLCRLPCPEDGAEQLARLRRHVENDVPEAINHLGNSYRNGKFGFARSDKKAFRIYKRAVELGSVEAMVNLGCLYDKLTFIKRDRKKAKQLFRGAAARGDPLGQLLLAESIQFEPGGDLEEAKLWFERAVAGGLKDAKHGLEHLLMATAPPTDVELRFKIGDSVECKLNGRWVSGKIVALWYRHARLPAGIYMPYQIEMEDGVLIYVPEDSDDCIRARLRFAIGTEVEVFSQDSDHDEPGPGELLPGSWAAGKVIDTWVDFEPAEHERARARANHLDEEELCAKYEVEYEEGNRGFVLYDDDLSIRLSPSSQETSEADVLRMYHSLGLSHS